MNHSSSPAPDSAAKSGDGTTARTWVSLRRLSSPGVRIFTPANVPSSSSSSSAYAYAYATWYTDGKFKVMYQKLWGL